MRNDRLRSSVKSEYLEALGRVAYTFASCEWQVAWSCERLRPGSLHKIVDEELTAGKIAKVFIDLSRNMPKSNERGELQAIAQRFTELVAVRNGILHGKPCTAPDGEQRLSASEVVELGDLESAADDFSECGMRLNLIYYSFLKSYAPP
jgi:hypothetical protein